MMYFNPKSCRGLNLSFFGFGTWAIYYPWYGQFGNFIYLSNINFDDTI